jgi:FkbM family methyltransferase
VGYQSEVNLIERIFTTAVRPLVGTGIGRIKPLANIYQKLNRAIMPSEKVIEVQGFKIKVIAQGYIGDISTELLYKGIHEPMSTEIFKRYIKEGDCVVDVGANVGYFTLLSAKLVGETGRVFAFEPDPMNMIELQNNVDLNYFQNVRPSLVALSDYNGRSKFYLSTRESARHSLIQTKEHDESTMVEVTKLDDYFPCSYPLHFLKSDTEGNELAVLKGAKETINRNEGIKLLVEVNTDALYAQKVAVTDLWNYLTLDLNFKYIYTVDDYKKKVFKTTLRQLLQYLKRGHLGCNLLCSRLSVDKLR